MSKKTFKIVTGFGEKDYFRIGKDEVARAYHCFLTEGKMITSEGVALRGRNILRIEPNWNEIMGYTRDHKLSGEDYLDIGEKRQRHANSLMGIAKENARECIESGDMNILSKTLDVKQLESSTNSKLSIGKMKLVEAVSVKKI
ncbi:MAG: hypothetical protein ACTSQE_14880 [Candidatus Heimdallarchaeaceae archaeon]